MRVLLLLVLLLIILFYTTREKYQEIPDACVHMMEHGGFSDEAISACENYAKRCGDSCSPYPMTGEKLKEIYAKLNIPSDGQLSAAQISGLIKAFNTGDCIAGLGPGNPCTPGDEECQSPYVCGADGKCKCQGVDCSVDGTC